MNATELNLGNQMIALFIGMIETNSGWYDHEEVLKLPYTKDNTFDTLRFDQSFDWSIVPFRQIKNLGITCDDEGYNLIENCDYALTDGSIRGFFDALCEFIEWYVPYKKENDEDN